MNPLEALGGAQGISAMARELGVDPSMVEKGAATLLPMVLGGFKSQAAAQPDGIEGLLGMLGKMGGGGLLDAVLGNEPTPVDQGNQLLGQIFGSQDVTHEVATQAAARTGLGADLLKQMLPMIAMAAGGFMARQAAVGTGGEGGLGGLVGQVVGALTGGGGSQGGLGTIAALLDANKDGNPLDDILRMVQR